MGAVGRPFVTASPALPEASSVPVLGDTCKRDFPFQLPTAPHYPPLEGFQRTIFLAGSRGWGQGPVYPIASPETADCGLPIRF